MAGMKYLGKRDHRVEIDRLLDWYIKSGKKPEAIHTGLKREQLAKALDMAPSHKNDSHFNYRGFILLPE